MLWRAREIISKQCLSGPKYNHQCVMYPTLCIYIFWKCIYSWRGFVIADAPMLCMTHAQIFHAFMLVLYIYFQTRSCHGQCTPCQNSSWFCLTQGKLYTQQEFWGFMLDVVWERADYVFWNGLYSPSQAISLKSARFHQAEDISEAKHKNLSDLFLSLLLQPRHARHSTNVTSGLSGAVTVSRKSNGHRIYLEGRLRSDSKQKLTELSEFKCLTHLRHIMLNDKKPQPKPKTLRTDKPWSHSAFGLDGSVQTLLHKMLLTVWDRCVQGYHIQNNLPGPGIWCTWWC